jgi:hypothetical protein
VNALWQCAVCETVNHGGRSCAACGAPLTRRSAAATAVRSRLGPAPAPPTAAAPLPEPVQRAINREPIDETEWLDDPAVFDMLSWAPDERRSTSRFGFWGPVPYYSTRTRGGSEVSVGGCCLLIPLVSLVGAGAASWALARGRPARASGPRRAVR